LGTKNLASTEMEYARAPQAADNKDGDHE
jgi:hypothetical protein